MRRDTNGYVKILHIATLQHIKFVITILAFYCRSGEFTEMINTVQT